MDKSYHHATEDVTIGAYFALFHSHLRYCLLAWGAAAEIHVHEIFVLQKRAIRTITKARRDDNCKPLFRRLGILPLPSMFIRESLLHIKKLPEPIRTCEIHHYQTHQHLRQPRTSSMRGQNGTRYWGYKFYNRLPDEYRRSSVTDFRRKIDHLLKNNVFYTKEEFMEFMNLH